MKAYNVKLTLLPSKPLYYKRIITNQDLMKYNSSWKTGDWCFFQIHLQYILTSYVFITYCLPKKSSMY